MYVHVYMGVARQRVLGIPTQCAVRSVFHLHHLLSKHQSPKLETTLYSVHVEELLHWHCAIADWHSIARAAPPRRPLSAELRIYIPRGCVGMCALCRCLIK